MISLALALLLQAAPVAKAPKVAPVLATPLAEAMMRRSGIRWLSTTTKSIEEIATTILQEIRPERLIY